MLEMSTIQTKILKPKLGLLELAKQLGNGFCRIYRAKSVSFVGK
ncbi:hypothetical protein [Wolbachia endosymbiont of Diaphorina citri]|nr:hypothetical protein [Wolbachia endosymbiont of Diaphorina citri]